VTCDVPEALGVIEGVSELLTVGVGLAVSDGASVRLGVPVSVALGVALGVALARRTPRTAQLSTLSVTPVA